MTLLNLLQLHILQTHVRLLSDSEFSDRESGLELC